MMITNTQDRPITANGDGPITVPAADEHVDPWLIIKRSEDLLTQRRLERQLRAYLRRLVAAEAVRLGGPAAVNGAGLALRVAPFVLAAVEEHKAVRQFAQLELQL